MQEVVFSGHQPNFIPYMGFFYKMFKSDIFVLDDDVQYSCTELQNSNFIKVNGQAHRITVPVHYHFGDPINRVEIDYNKGWREKLLKTLRMNYGKAPYFDLGYQLMEKHLMETPYLLNNLNVGLLKDIATGFDLKCKILIASEDVPTPMKNNARNIFQCTQLGGTVYYSGVGGRAYNDEAEYADAGIQIVYSDYKPVQYKQGKGGFIPNLSVLDYIFYNGFSLPEDWRK